MPLIEGKSHKSFEKNLKTEMHHDKPLKQSLAIAYAMKRKAEKHREAEGGEAGAHGSDMHMCPGGECTHESHMAHGGITKKMDGGDAVMEHEHHIKSKHDRAMEAFHGKKMAEGGMMTKDGYQSHEKPEVDGDLMPEAHKHLELEEEHVSHPDSHDSHMAHEEFNQMGDEDEGAGDMNAIHPMVMRIMMGREKGYSEGGMVANEESGESSAKPTMGKWEDNEFDDLAKEDDLEFKSTGANAGDELGDEAEDHDRNDIVSRIMKSRSKKDKMAVSGEGSNYGKRK